MAAAKVARKPRATSDVGMLLSVALAAPIYGVLLLAADSVPDKFRSLLLERGWIPHVIMVLTALSASILILKLIMLRVQRRAFRTTLIPDVWPRITPDNVGAAIEHVESLTVTKRRVPSILIDRVLRLLEHFAARGDVAETANINSSDADADAGAVASSFSIVKVLVWAIPIVGFIGTVIGIGVAVGGFSASLEGAEQIDAIKSSLGEVTSGLAIAFDTTLVALVASILVMFPTSAMQKAEERLVDDVDDFCVREVLRRLAAAGEAEDEAGDDADRPLFDAEALKCSIVAALSAPVAEMMRANAQLMSRLSADHEALAAAQSGLEQAQQKLAHHQQQIAGQLGAFAAAAETLGPNVQQAVAQLERATALAERTTASAGASQEQLCRELGASRQLLSVLAAGMGQPVAANDAPAVAGNGAHSGNGKSGRPAGT